MGGLIEPTENTPLIRKYRQATCVAYPYEKRTSDTPDSVGRRAVIAISLSDLLGNEGGPPMYRLGLAPCGVYRAAHVAVRAVRSYRTFSPLPLRAVCFLWHFPSEGI